MNDYNLLSIMSFIESPNKIKRDLKFESFQ